MTIPVGDVASGTTLTVTVGMGLRLNGGGPYPYSASIVAEGPANQFSARELLNDIEQDGREIGSGRRPNGAQGGNTADSAKIIEPDTLYFGHIGYNNWNNPAIIQLTDKATGVADVDYFRIPAQAPGSRIVVSLDPVDVDTDLGLFKADTTSAPPGSAATPAKPLDLDPIGEDRPGSHGRDAASAFRRRRRLRPATRPSTPRRTRATVPRRSAPSRTVPTS